MRQSFLQHIGRKVEPGAGIFRRKFDAPQQQRLLCLGFTGIPHERAEIGSHNWMVRGMEQRPPHGGFGIAERTLAVACDAVIHPGFRVILSQLYCRCESFRRSPRLIQGQPDIPIGIMRFPALWGRTTSLAGRP